MSSSTVRFVKVDARPTAVVAQTTTWEQFPALRVIASELPAGEAAATTDRGD